MKRWSKILMKITPADTRVWMRAMLAELQVLPSSSRGPWLFGALQLALVARLCSCLYGLKVVALSTTLIAVDWMSGAFPPALLLIVVSAAALSRDCLKRSPGALLVASAMLPLAHLVANWLPALRPAYQYAPLNIRDWLTLVAVALIGLCSVGIAAEWRSARELRAVGS